MPSSPHPDLLPFSTISAKRLPSTGSTTDVVSAGLPPSIYRDSPNFTSGAIEQITYVYQFLAGNILDVELQPENVVFSYYDACAEYSKLVNLHQSKNALGSLLGAPTGTFGSSGDFLSGSTLSGSINPALTFPRFSIGYSKQVSIGLSNAGGIGGDTPLYSASIDLVDGIQQYDLQQAIALQASSSTALFSGAFASAAHKKITVHRVYYKSPSATWRFYGANSGFSVIGNLYSYGQYADSTTYEIIPAWHNKLQGIVYQTNLYTRGSHYRYEIHDNKIVLYPPPREVVMPKLWFLFAIDVEPWQDSTGVSGSAAGVTNLYGVNNFNTLPFANIPYENINSIGKQWIRRWSLATCKEMLAQSRGKFASIPIPDNEVTLNADALLSQAEKEKENLRQELLDYLDKLTYLEVSNTEKEITENTEKVLAKIPLGIYVG